MGSQAFPLGYPQGDPLKNDQKLEKWQTQAVNASTLKHLARLGYASRGIVYAILGLFALSAALTTEHAQGEKAVWRAILQQPLGQGMLVIVGAGLLAYATYRTVQAISDTEGRGTSNRGLLHRLGGMGSAFVNAVLGIAAIGAAIPAAKKATGAGQGTPASLTADALAQPFGEWLVGFAGLILIAVGLYQISIAWGQSFQDKLRLEEMSAAEKTWALRAGTAGIMARGAVFLVTGGLVVRAGFTESPEQTGSLQATLRTIEALGPWYLALVAFGLCAFAVYQFFQARYPKV